MIKVAAAAFAIAMALVTLASAFAAPVQPAVARAAPAPAAPVLDVQADLQALSQLQTKAEATSDDGALAALAVQTARIEATAQADEASNAAAISVANNGLRRYALAARQHRPATDTRLRAALTARRSALTTQLTQARQVATSATDVYNLIAERRRNEFGARVLRRSASPVSPRFWTTLADAGAVDAARLATLSLDAENYAEQAPEPQGALDAGAGLALALLLMFPVRTSLSALGRRASTRPGAPEALSRSLQALWTAAADTLLPGLAAIALHLGAQWGGVLSEKADDLAGAAAVAITWGAAILALGRALVTDAATDQRLGGLPGSATQRIRFALWAVAVVTAAGFLLTRLNYLIGASVASTIAANNTVSVAYCAVAALVLVSFRAAGPGAEQNAPTDRARGSGWTLVALLFTLAIVATLGAVAAGYANLAALISGQIFWLSVLSAAFYLLVRFIDDACAALFRPRGWAARALVAVFAIRRSTVEQIGVLVTAVLQVMVLIGALTLALTPFGQSGSLLLASLGGLGKPFHIGSATISPTAVATGLASLVVGLLIVRFVRAWLVRRYLPVTGWDTGLRNSVATGVGYLGVTITLLCALGAMGLGFQQIALIASALSIGVGFGLQQVVQNFVSGVILLIERPVKVGDWVSVDEIEGDIRRIRVRATEIQTFDRSTVIVPNSDLISKKVRNRTLGEPGGRVQLQFSVLNPADARKAEGLVLTLAGAAREVLEKPAPAVFIDSLASAGGVNFVCFLYIANPRDVTRVRSALYFDLLDALQKHDVPLAGAAGAQNVVLEPGPTLKSILEQAPKP